ncbi:MAG: YigZ family protein, partial [Microscillaceae bacterium]|nr:YigZ family protein [Microscillaceae bacterium]
MLSNHSGAYLCLLAAGKAHYRKKGSRFLAFALPVQNETEVESHLRQLRQEHPQATHHCYAYSLGPAPPRTRAHDDGEPKHSAGTPILQQIRARNLSDVLVVVVRYFGGTKLGVSGLVQAYKTAAQAALQMAPTTWRIPQVQLEIRYAYEQAARIQQFIHRFAPQILAQNFTETGHILLQLPRGSKPRPKPGSSKPFLEPMPG